MDLFGQTRRIEALIKKASTTLTKGDFESAWRLYEQVLLLDEDNLAANTFGAICLYSLSRVDEAEPLARAAVQLAPSMPLGHLYLAFVLLAKEQSVEGEFELWEAVAVAPDNSEIRQAL